MESRKVALTKLYTGPVWKANGRVASGTMVDSDNVLLLRPLHPDTAFGPSTIKLPPPGTRGPNTYPILPVREQETVFVWFSLFPDQASVEKHQRALVQSMQWREAAGQLTAWTHHKIETLRLEPTARSRLQRG